MIWIFSILIVVVLAIIFTTVRAKIEYKRIKEDDRIYLELMVWRGLLTLKFDIPMLKVKTLVEGVKVKQEVALSPEQGAPNVVENRFRLTYRDLRYWIRQFRRLRRRVHDFNEVVKTLVRHVRCEQIEWTSTIGTGDAAVTGVSTGFVYTVKSCLITVFSRYVKLQEKPQLRVIPAYQSVCLDTSFQCILRIRVGHAIIAGIRIVMNLLKRKGEIYAKSSD